MLARCQNLQTQERKVDLWQALHVHTSVVASASCVLLSAELLPLSRSPYFLLSLRLMPCIFIYGCSVQYFPNGYEKRNEKNQQTHHRLSSAYNRLLYLHQMIYEYIQPWESFITLVFQVIFCNNQFRIPDFIHFLCRFHYRYQKCGHRVPSVALRSQTVGLDSSLMPYTGQCSCEIKKVQSERKLHTTEMHMLRWARGKTRLDHVRNVDIWKEAYMSTDGGIPQREEVEMVWTRAKAR